MNVSHYSRPLDGVRGQHGSLRAHPRLQEDPPGPAYVLIFELQAVNRLARLWQGRGRTQEAHALLSALYGSFSEGYDGLVLEEARAILKDLR